MAAWLLAAAAVRGEPGAPLYRHMAPPMRAPLACCGGRWRTRRLATAPEPAPAAAPQQGLRGTEMHSTPTEEKARILSLLLQRVARNPWTIRRFREHAQVFVDMARYFTVRGGRAARGARRRTDTRHREATSSCRAGRLHWTQRTCP